MELSFQMRDLHNFYPTCAFIILNALESDMKTKQIIGKTECIYDNTNPNFVSNIEIEYNLEESKKLVLEVYNMKDDDNPDLL